MDSELPAEPSNPADDFTDAENTKGQAAISSPISKLPVELLAGIFRLNIPHYSIWVAQAHSRDASEFQRRLGWVVVTWVCRQWRDIALNDPTLWTIIPTNFPTWSLAMLERSKTAGIFLNMHGVLCSPQRRGALLPSILANGIRVAGLTLQFKDSDIMSGVLAHFTSTPQLSQLYLEYSRRDRRIKLPNNIFRDITCLHNLDLRGVDLDWNSHLLCGPLRELTIIDVSPNERPTMSQFGRVLENLSPTLKTLVLMQALPLTHLTDELRPFSEFNGPLLIPLLERLDLEGEAGMLSALFNAIKLGDRLEELSITTTINQPHIDIVSLLTALNRNVCFAEFCTTVTQLVVGFQDIRAFEQDGSKWEQTPGQGALKYFNLDLRYSTNMIIDNVAVAEASPLFVEDIFRILHWTNLRELTLNLDWQSHPMPQLSDALRRTFGTLNGVKCLTLLGTMTTKYSIEALYIDSDSITTSAEQMPFPALESIHIINCTFTTSTSTVAGTADSNRLLRMAEKRDQLGFPIAKIEFHYSIGFSDIDFSSLKRRVSEIVWDEYDRYLNDDEGDFSESSDSG